ncbi:hypothetical protein [Isoptericola sediminis]|uniref:Uncharacterized protein n=1 Tax=Isoptericola sediminis TaxID=2733572 RepID=A0A849K8T0_9MICO|nr:hypothetical protein [Isoptericola sediminis]NNU28429.1 hypothetical protein [Isoptericola sediminis]
MRALLGFLGAISLLAVVMNGTWLTHFVGMSEAYPRFLREFFRSGSLALGGFGMMMSLAAGLAVPEDDAIMLALWLGLAFVVTAIALYPLIRRYYDPSAPFARKDLFSAARTAIGLLLGGACCAGAALIALVQ